MRSQVLLPWFTASWQQVEILWQILVYSQKILQETLCNPELYTLWGAHIFLDLSVS